MKRAMIFLLAGAAAFVGYKVWPPLQPALALSQAWQADLDLLGSHGKLPQAFKHLRTVEVKGGDEAAQALVDQVRVPLKISPDGTHSLDVLVTSFSEGPQWSAVLHYHLIEDKSGDLVWELGRTLSFNSLRPEKIRETEALR